MFIFLKIALQKKFFQRHETVSRGPVPTHNEQETTTQSAGVLSEWIVILKVSRDPTEENLPASSGDLLKGRTWTVSTSLMYPFLSVSCSDSSLFSESRSILSHQINSFLPCYVSFWSFRVGFYEVRLVLPSLVFRLENLYDSIWDGRNTYFKFWDFR